MHTGRAAGRRIPEARRVQGPTAVALTCGLAWFLTGNASTARPRPTTAESESISVVTPEEADEIQRFAAAELVRYLRQVTGKSVETDRSDTKHKIYLGTIPGSLAVTDSQQLRADVQSLQEDGF